MKNISITWDMFPGACYDPADRYGECPDTLLDLLNDERVPVKDRIWAFCNCTGVDDRTKRLFAVRCVRETPIGGGKTVYDLLTDERSRKALDVAEAYAKGKATNEELIAAREAAATKTTERAARAAWAATMTTMAWAATAWAAAATTSMAWADRCAMWADRCAAARTSSVKFQLSIAISMIKE